MTTRTRLSTHKVTQNDFPTYCLNFRDSVILIQAKSFLSNMWFSKNQSPVQLDSYVENSLLLKLKTFWLKYKCFPITKVTFGLCWTCQSVGYFGPNGVEKFTFSAVQTKLLIKKFHKIISTLGNSVHSKYLFFETVLSNILWFKVERNFFVISIVIRILSWNYAENVPEKAVFWNHLLKC